MSWLRDLWTVYTHQSAYESRPEGPLLTCLECDEDWPCSSVVDLQMKWGWIPMKKTYDVSWKSTPEERYDTPMNETAARIAGRHVTVISREGGTSLSTNESDNSLIVEAGDDDMVACLAELERYLDRKISVEEIE